MKHMRGIVLADLHYGAIDGSKLYRETDEIIFHFLREQKTLDVIFIAGDFFDHILYLNEPHAQYAFMFMETLFREAKRLGAKIRIVYGTESHECGQYSVFTSKFLDSSIDARVIHSVEEEELFEDIYVLYLPEEYIYNKDDYYKDYFTGDKKYDYIIGHGVIQELMPTASFHMSRSTKDSSRAKPPIFTSRELIENCHGQIYFGHYHINSEIQDKIFYVGSFTRWMFGEEERKGFYYIEKNKDKYSNEFIENTMAETYTTISYGYDNHAFSSDDNLTKELTKIENLSPSYDHLRIQFNLPETFENAEATVTMIKDRFKNNKAIKVDVTNGYVDKSKKINKEYLDKTIEKYGMIFDKNLPIEEKSHQFILKKFEQDISAERIKWHMNTQDVMKE